ncbi:MAG: acyltransferase family protein [Maricaulaceae bacterium]
MTGTHVQPGHGRLEDRRNNFTAVRLMLAGVVLASHVLMIPHGQPAPGGLHAALDTMSQFALDGFFILSGYMLAASLARSSDMTGFAIARVLRIFPGIIAAALVVVFGLGLAFTSLGSADYLSAPETWAALAKLITQADPLTGLPGVFETHPRGEANTPLWTIRYELMCYAAAGLLAGLGAWRSRVGFWAVTLLALTASVGFQTVDYNGPLDDTLYAGARFGAAFMIGAAFFRYRDRIPLTWPWIVVEIGLAVVLKDTPAGPVMAQFATAFVVLGLGFLVLPGGSGRVVRGLPDISYGVYILHWPIGQAAYALNPEISPLALLAIMAIGAVGAGAVMRLCVEKPALAAKPHLRAWIAGHSQRQPRRRTTRVDPALASSS